MQRKEIVCRVVLKCNISKNYHNVQDKIFKQINDDILQNIQHSYFRCKMTHLVSVEVCFTTAIDYHL